MNEFDVCKSLRKKLVEKYNSRLTGYCGFSSFVLCRCLFKLGFDPVVIEGEFKYRKEFSASHCWVELNGTILDLTATQFTQSSDEIPDIVIVKANEGLGLKYICLNKRSFKSYIWWGKWWVGLEPVNVNAFVKDILGEAKAKNIPVRPLRS